MSERFTNSRLSVCAEEYLRYHTVTNSKAKATLYKEELALNGWTQFLRDPLLRRITLDDIREYASERAELGASNRTINLDVTALRNVLEWFRDSGKLPSPLCTTNWVNLDHTTPLRKLIPSNSVELVDIECSRRDSDGADVYPTGKFLSDYIKLLAWSGARKTSALEAKWSNVDWNAEQISFFGKYDKTVFVDFNPKLKAHLLDMFARRNPESDFLFPGETFDHVVSPYTVFGQVRTAIGMPNLQLHDFRHFFISHAVMKGIDTLTIAKWVGHADGGVLIGKVYGHLSNPHLKSSAAKLTFGE